MDDYPVKVRIEYPERSSRGWAVLTILLIKLLALIPHGIVLFALGIAAAVVFVIAQMAVLARGVFPPGLFAFLTGYIRWYTRVEAFFLSVTDRYPPFSLESDPDYPVDVEVEYPQEQQQDPRRPQPAVRGARHRRLRLLHPLLRRPRDTEQLVVALQLGLVRQRRRQPPRPSSGSSC